MDNIASLSAAAVTALAPYLAKAGEKFAEEAGKAALAKIEDLYQYLKTRFTNEPAAREALGDLEASPADEDVKATFRRQLTKQMNADPSFQDALQNLLKDIDQDKKSMSFLVQVYGGEVKNITQIGGDVDTLTIH
jgi:hypothetical protein